MTHWVPLAVVACYVVALFAVTWWSQRLAASGGIVGYLLAGRQLPYWVTAAALAGLAVGGASTIGVAEAAYKSGFSAGWYNAAWAAGAFVMGLLTAGRYRRLELTTLPEFFDRHYGTAARVLAVLGQLAIQVVVTSLQYVAGGAILSSLMPGVFTFRSGMVVTAVVFIGITLIGGLWATGLTNVLNVAVIYVGIVAGVVLTVGRIGGFAGLLRQLPAGHPGFDLWAVGAGLIAGWFMVMITTAQSTQAVVQISFASKDDRSARWGFLLGGLLIFPVGFLCAIIGMAAAVLHPSIVAAEALPRAVLDLPPLAAGLVLSGLWAADVSTASALLMGSASLVLNDIVKRFIRPGLGDVHGRAVCRLTVLALSVVTYLLALFVSGILKMLLIGLTLTTAFTLVVLMTMFWPAVCRQSSATWTMVATYLSLAGWLAAPASWHFLPHPIYFTWLISLVAFFAVTALDRRRIA
ncbi:MAG: sodium:solute symporter family protein [Acidobacteriota bacterium]